VKAALPRAVEVLGEMIHAARELGIAIAHHSLGSFSMWLSTSNGMIPIESGDDAIHRIAHRDDEKVVIRWIKVIFVEDRMHMSEVQWRFLKRCFDRPTCSFPDVY
jgi:hypothetical protein